MIGCAIGKGLELVIATAFGLGTAAALVLAEAQVAAFLVNRWLIARGMGHVKVQAHRFGTPGLSIFEHQLLHTHPLHPVIVPRRPITSADVTGHYDDLDRFYREVWGEHVHHGLWLTGDEPAEVAVRQLVERVAAEARLVPGMQICDVGCGYGATARQLAETHGARVTGLTISPAQHAYAEARTPGDNPTYYLRDWLANGLPDAAFDAVVSIECLSHVPDKAAFFREAARVLRPDGRLVVSAWLAAEVPTPWQVRHLLEPICSEGRLPGLATASEVQDWIAAAGFDAFTLDDLSGQVQRTWTLIVWRVLSKLLTDRRYLGYLLNVDSRDRIFALTLPRLWLGYRTGALRYGLFTAVRGGLE